MQHPPELDRASFSQRDSLAAHRPFCGVLVSIPGHSHSVTETVTIDRSATSAGGIGFGSRDGNAQVPWGGFVSLVPLFSQVVPQMLTLRKSLSSPKLTLWDEAQQKLVGFPDLAGARDGGIYLWSERRR